MFRRERWRDRDRQTVQTDRKNWKRGEKGGGADDM